MSSIVGSAEGEGEIAVSDEGPAWVWPSTLWPIRSRGACETPAGDAADGEANQIPPWCARGQRPSRQEGRPDDLIETDPRPALP